MPWCKRWLATLLVFLVVLIALGGLVTLFAVPWSRRARSSPTTCRGSSPTCARARADRRPGAAVQLRRYADAERLQATPGCLLPSTADHHRRVHHVAGIVTIFVLAYLMVLEAPRIIDGSLALFDGRRAERIRRVGADCARTVTATSRQPLISLICGLLTYVVLLIMGVPSRADRLFVAIADLIRWSVRRSARWWRRSPRSPSR
jgi:predicted PurR-regulated permease PerM